MEVDHEPQTKEEFYRSVKNQSPTRRKKTSIACVSCWKAKTACSVKRPCERCERLGKSESCVDRPASTRKRQFLSDKKKPRPRIRKKKKSKTTPTQQKKKKKEIHRKLPLFATNAMPTFQINNFDTSQNDNKLKNLRMKKKGMKRMNEHKCCNEQSKCKKRRISDLNWTDDKNGNCNTETNINIKIEKQTDKIQQLIQENNDLKRELNDVKIQQIADKEKLQISKVNNNFMQQQMSELKNEISVLKTQNTQLVSDKQILTYKITEMTRQNQMVNMNNLGYQLRNCNNIQMNCDNIQNNAGQQKYLILFQ